MSAVAEVGHLVSRNAPLLGVVPFVPLIGACLVWLLTNRNTRAHALSGWVATAASSIAFGLVVTLFIQLNSGDGSTLTAHLWNWFSVGQLDVQFALTFDHLSSVMCMIITGVGSLIHLYAIGYMHEDESRPRFFCYLNLFLFAMLLLVLGSNLLVMFVGWEGVGLCSYLLIGFWFKEMPNANAGQKAFVVNRIGDAGFLLGIFILFWRLGSIDFVSLSEHVRSLPPGLIEAAAFCLFIGAVGKSAQIPLYIWLPDAMAGPTPVSALIHAATMVTAGVYMMARMEFLYRLAPDTLAVIAAIGCLTAFVAATIALVQNDIKKVLAYSTVSQLGYMFMAMGSGAFSNGIFHVVTHAFFKACLFMCAGSVIMGCHHEQDMRHFGGLRKKMPITFACYFVATLAIAGFPYLSGFFSKDAILWTVFTKSAAPGIMPFGMRADINRILYAMGLITAFMTAFYMTRSLMLTFFGEYRGHAHPHESPWVVTVPLVILAALSAGFCWVIGPHEFYHYLEHWTRPDLFQHNELEMHTEHVLEIVSMLIAVAGMSLAVLIYGYKPEIAASSAERYRALYGFLSNKWWVDEFFGATVQKPLRFISQIFFRVFDRIIIDGSVNGTGMVVEATGDVARFTQSGRISQYTRWMFAGSFLLILFYLILS